MTRFSIVTPVYNGAKYISETIESILSQEGDFEIEYIVGDGGSTDNTLDIVRSYAEKVGCNSYPARCQGLTMKWFSGKDRGMYDAINQGFGRATGDIYAWLNADDLYQPGALAKIKSVLDSFPEISWLKGITSTINIHTGRLDPGDCFIYDQGWIKRGLYGRDAYFIHQDSVFWRKELWQKAGPIDTKYRLAGDYYLWIRFAEHSPLWSFNADLSVFRELGGQLSQNREAYLKEQAAISGKRGLLERAVRTFFRLKARSPAFLNPFFDRWYGMIFPGANRFYVDFLGPKPVIKRSVSYVTEKNNDKR